MLDWEKAYLHLLEIIAAYAEIGRSGTLGLHLTLLPLYRRYQKGERTDVLYDEMISAN